MATLGLIVARKFYNRMLRRNYNSPMNDVTPPVGHRSAPSAPLAEIELPQLQWSNRFAGLSESFYTRLAPTPLPEPYPIHVSEAAAALLGLTGDELSTDKLTEVLTGNRSVAGADPLASVYSGHQFGQWAGQLGDGRAILLGEARPAGDTHAPGWEIQLKGAGQTPYSRFADGRAVLRSSIREYLCSEAMHALGVPTTRALSITGSDYPIVRETVETAAVVARLAPSFIRFGHFEHFYYGRDEDNLQRLTQFVIDHYFPECRDRDNPAQAMLAAVADRTALLIAQWQSIGFCHGVMNTDNMSILGLTIDYGPFGFLDGFDRGHICNHTDQAGRYSYQNQPQIGHWNCFALAQALLPLIGSVDDAKDALADYQAVYQREYDRRMNAKIGLSAVQSGDADLVKDLLDILQQGRVDFTVFFRAMVNCAGASGCHDDPTTWQQATRACRDLVIDRPGFDQWLGRYEKRLDQDPQAPGGRAERARSHNPAIVLRNHLAQTAIEQASTKNFAPLQQLAQALGQPYADPEPSQRHFAALPPDWAASLSVSCSS